MWPIVQPTLGWLAAGHRQERQKGYPDERVLLLSLNHDKSLRAVALGSIEPDKRNSIAREMWWLSISQGKRALLSASFVFLLPVLGLVVLILNRTSSSEAPKEVAAFLTTLWQVQGTVAGASIVLFVFLLQTVNLSRRTSTTILTLAIRSGILSASIYGLSSTFAVGLALALFSVGHVITWLSAICAAIVAFLNFPIVLLVLGKTLGYLSGKDLSRLQRELLLDEVRRATISETIRTICFSRLCANTEDGPVADLYSPSKIEPGAAWKLRARKPRLIRDLNLESIGAVASTLVNGGKCESPSIQILAAVGSIVNRGEAVLAARTTPNLVDRIKLRFAIKWESVPAENDALLLELSDELQGAVHDGDIARFRETIKLGVSVTNKCLQTLGDLGLGSADGADGLGPISSVRDMLRFGLEEALKTKRADFALSTADAVYSVARSAAGARNPSAFGSFLRLYTFLRSVVLSLEGADPKLFGDIYWRNLTELARFPLIALERKDGDAAFTSTALGLIEATIVEMLRDAIQGQAKDIDLLLEAHRIAFQYTEVSRTRRSRRGSESIREQQAGPHWMILGGWAIYLLEIGSIQPAFAREVLGKLGRQFPDRHSLLEATVVAARRDDADNSELSNWILWTKAEGIAHGMDSRGPVVSAAIAMIVLQLTPPSFEVAGTMGAGEEPSNPEPSQSRSNLNFAAGVEDAHELADGVESLVKILNTEGSPSSKSFSSLGLLSPHGQAAIASLSQSFSEALVAHKADERARLRAAPVDPNLQKSFAEAVRTVYFAKSITRTLPAVITILDGPLDPDPNANGVGYNELLPKDLFTEGAEPQGQEYVSDELGEGLYLGEMYSILNSIAMRADVVLVKHGELLDRLVDAIQSTGGGVAFIDTGQSRSGLFRHAAFEHLSEKIHVSQIGNLAGVPILRSEKSSAFAAIYLPPASLTVRYAVYDDPPSQMRSMIEPITEGMAEEMVRDWEKGGLKLNQAERKAKVEHTQESVIYRALVRSEVSAQGATVFQTVDAAADELPD